VPDCSRRAFAAGVVTAAVSVAGCTAPLYETHVAVVNTADEAVEVYVAVVVKTLVNADSQEWTLELAPGESRNLTFSTGQEQATEVIVDPSTGRAERTPATDGEVRAEVSEHGVYVEVT
jgi:hypothetical protein